MRYHDPAMETPRIAGTRPLLWLLLTLLAGCAATPQVQELRRDAGGLPPRVELDAVPFFPQERYQCGPAALATALQVAGAEATPEALLPEVYLPDRRGSLQMELLAASRRRALVPYVLAPDLRALLREVAAGHPVVVLQNLGVFWAPAWHYAVVIGYDLDTETVLLRSGRTRRLETPMTTFERTWQRGERWALVVLAPAELPVTAERRAYVRAVAPLERLGHWSASRAAYQAALARWPDDLAAGLGLGNALYGQGERRAAAAAFRAVTEAQPDSAAAFNNLAHVLLELGELADADRAARRAVELGGPREDVYRRTLQSIQKQRNFHENSGR